MLESRQQFEVHLSELKGKAELLSTTLDKEVSQRMNTQEEVGWRIDMYNVMYCVYVHVDG